METSKPKNFKSAVWKYFSQKITDGVTEKGYVVCLLCKRTYKTSGSTSPMMSHLLRSHPVEHQSLRKPPIVPKSEPRSSISFPEEFYFSPTTSNDHSTAEREKDNVETPHVLDEQPKSDLNDDRQMRINYLIINHIIEDMLPLTLVNSASFQELIEFLDPEYTVPDHKTVSKELIPRRYEETKMSVAIKLAKLSSVSLTIDQWTSLSGDEYSTLTVHGINDDWNLTHLTLMVLHFPSHLTSSCIADHIKEKFREWNLSDTEIVAATTERGLRVVNTVNMLGYQHIPCLANAIHVSVTTKVLEFEGWRGAITKCKRIASLLHHSPLLRNILTQMQLQQPSMAKPTCPTVSETRWNSVFALLCFIEANALAINQTLCNCNKTSLMLSSSELGEISKCCAFLRPLVQAIESFAGEEYVSSSLVLPFSNALSSRILAPNEDSLSTIRNLKQNLSSSISSYYQVPEIRTFLLQCSFIDPRFKDLKFSTEEERIQVKRLIAMRTRPVEAVKVEEKRRKLTFLESSLCEDDKSTFSVKIDSSSAELEAYCTRETAAPIFTDPLEWWRERKCLYPSLSEVAKQLLSATATTAPAERRFSKIGDSINNKRASLSCKMVEKIVFLHENNTEKSFEYPYSM